MNGEFRRDQVIRVYREAARYYDIWGTLFESRTHRKVAALAALEDGESLLDVGVGTGQLFIELARRNPNGNNVGIDLTEEMVHATRAKAQKAELPGCSVKTGDAYRIDQLGRTVDVLVNTFMFELLPRKDYGKVLGEFHRVLKPGGRLVLAGMTPARNAFHKIAEKICQGHPAWMGGFGTDQLVEELRALGFAEIARFPVEQLSFPSEVLFARKSP